MGGIGKTVTGAALVRDDKVRMFYDQIIWIPLGQVRDNMYCTESGHGFRAYCTPFLPVQTPVIEKLHSLALKQLNGNIMPNDASLEEKKELLRRAMEGKRVLLCLDGE